MGFLRATLAALLFLTAYAAPHRGTPQKPPKLERPKAPAAAKAPATERQWVQRWMKTMSLRDRAAQLIVVVSYGEAPASSSRAFKDFVHQVRDLKVGGMIVANRVVGGAVRNAEPYAMAAFLNRMQKLSRVPLLVAADFERGASMRVSDTTKFPHLMAYGAANRLDQTRYLGAATAKEARALGVQWIFAPDADVNNNPENPIINIRSFGEDPQLVADHVKAFIEGAHSDPRNRVLTTVKHFPGHGDTAVDSHLGLASLSATRERMEELELVPFRAAITAGVDSIMTAHMAVPAVEKEDIPATVSKAVLTGLLREQLGYNGIIITDALDMYGISKLFAPGEAAVRAIQAGADVLLMPPDPDAAIGALVKAVNEGRLTRKRVDESVEKVLAAKVRVGLHRSKLVDIESIADTIQSADEAEMAQAVADKAVTLIKNERDAFPIAKPDRACVFVLSESRYGAQGRKLIEEVQKRSREVRIFPLDPLVPQIEIDAILRKASGCGQNIIAAFASVSAYRGSVALAGNFTSLVTTLLGGEAPVSFVSFGNPYLIRSFPSVNAYIATFSTSQTAETAVAKALFGEIQPHGKLPVSIPGYAKAGDGIIQQ